MIIVNNRCGEIAEEYKMSRTERGDAKMVININKRLPLVVYIIIFGLLAAMFVSGCSLSSPDRGSNSSQQPEQQPAQQPERPGQPTPSADHTTSPVYELPEIYIPTASGVAVEQNSQAIIDYSNMQNGYIMAKYIEPTDLKIKLLITVPDGVQYTYSLYPGKDFEVFPLSGGNGEYSVGVFRQVEDTRYSMVLSTTIYVTLVDEFAPFLRPNQYVNFNQNSEAVRKAAQLTAGISDLLEKVAAIYYFVTNNIVYDVELARTVESGYLPNVDRTLSTGKGICFDYAALMSAMLRSQGIPTKLVIGYTGDQYHAWISVFSEEYGWLDDIIYFDGETWSLVDPTFAAGGMSSESLSQFIGDGTNYTEKFFH